MLVLPLAFPAPPVAKLVKGRSPVALPIVRSIATPVCLCFPYGNPIVIWFRFPFPCVVVEFDYSVVLL